jgi:hypothetical protein
MLKLAMFIPELTKSRDIIYNYLSRHLTNDQINAYKDYLYTPTTTFGDAYRYITEELSLPDTIYHALNSFAKVSILCDAAASSPHPLTEASGVILPRKRGHTVKLPYPTFWLRIQEARDIVKRNAS